MKRPTRPAYFFIFSTQSKKPVKGCCVNNKQKSGRVGRSIILPNFKAKIFCTILAAVVVVNRIFPQ